MPDPNSVIQAALAWRDHIPAHHPDSDDHDLALIAAVDTYRGSADRTSIDQFLLAVHLCDDCRINANAARNRLASSPGSVPRASTAPADGPAHPDPCGRAVAAGSVDPGPAGGALPEIPDTAVEAAIAGFNRCCPSAAQRRCCLLAALTAALPHLATDEPVAGTEGGPWTRHGHPVVGITRYGSTRPPIARCGGPGMCGSCSADAERIRRGGR